MTAKEYLVGQLSDPYVEATSVQTQTALAAYAIRMYMGVDGYSIPNVEELLENCGITDVMFIERCTDFISHCFTFLMYQHRIPTLDD